jgi:hypothetical protein
VTDTTCVAPVILQMIAAGETTSGAGHVAGCAACQARVAGYREASAAFLRERPPELFLRKLRRRRKPWRSWLPLALCGALGLCLVVLPRASSEIRNKGASPLSVVYRRGNAEPLPVAPEHRLKAGDALRFSYAAPAPEQGGQGYLAILDVDAAGKVTAFYPYDGKRAAPLAGQGWLPGSVVLDSTQGPEWLIGIFASRPFDVAPLAAQLASLPPGATPKLACGDCRVDLLRIHKTP